MTNDGNIMGKYAQKSIDNITAAYPDGQAPISKVGTIAMAHRDAVHGKDIPAWAIPKKPKKKAKKKKK